jgi:hypothetical protein
MKYTMSPPAIKVTTLMAIGTACNYQMIVAMMVPQLVEKVLL